MKALNPRSILILAPLAASLVGCASSSSIPIPSDPAQMNAGQRFYAGYTDCARQDRNGEIIRIYPQSSAVTREPETFNYTWWCADIDGSSYPSSVSSHPIPKADHPGNGLIGASMEQTDSGIFIFWIAPGGSANENGELTIGDQVLSVKPTPDSQDVSLSTLNLNQATWLIRGEPGTEVQLTVQSPDNATPKTITLTRSLGKQSDMELLTAVMQERQQKAEQEARKSLVIRDNSGQYMSPYTSDRVTAEWVNKALNANIGATAGSAVGAAAGAYAANKALESVPFGSLLGGFVGSSVGKDIGRSTAIESIGGWDYVRSTSDMSFRSLADMAQYLKAEHGTDPNFGDVVNATSQIYPEFAAAFAAAR